MSFTIRNKLILIGLLAIIGLAASSYLSYVNIKELGTLNGISSVTTANGVLVQRMTLHRQELAESFYVALLHRGSGKIAQEDTDAMTGYASKLNGMTSRFVGREISYIDRAVEAKASSLAK
jgi:hypothetical protein